MKGTAMKSTTEIGLFEIFRTKFTEDESKGLVGEIKSMTQDDLAERIEFKVISTLTWRLFLFFLAQVSFTIALVKFMA